MSFTAIRKPVNRPVALLLGCVPFVVVLGIWTLLTRGEPEQRVLSITILPSPEEVWASLSSLLEAHVIVPSTMASLMRVVKGFIIGACLAIPIGVLMGAFSGWRSIFNPVSAIGGYTPIPALIPLTLVWFGIDELQKVMFLALATFVYLLPLTVAAMDRIDHVYLQTADTLGAGTWKKLTKVMIPMSMPEIFDAIRLCFGIGWAYIILAEAINAKSGLGNLILIRQRQGPKEHVYWVLIVIILIAFAMDKMLEIAGKMLFPYRHAR